MLVEEITSSVGTIETEAEKILEDARARASEILLNAREESGKILSAELPMDETQAECEQIIHQAREEAQKEIEGSKGRTAKIRSEVGDRLEGIVERIVSIVATGVDLK